MTTQKKKGLGRGLDAIFGTDEAPLQARPMNRMAEIAVADIMPNPSQPRTQFDQEALSELAASISQLGVIQPITVKRCDGGKYIIISGERRWRASQAAGLATLPAYIREVDDSNLHAMALVENIQRQDLNAIEIALTFKKLIDRYGLTQERLSERIGKKRATIANFIRLLRLPAEVQLGLRDRRIDMGHARALLSIDDPKLQLKIYNEILKQGLSVRRVEELAKKYREAGPEEENPAEKAEKRFSNKDFDILRDHLSHRFSTPVKVSCDASGKGKISFSFRDDDELQRLIAIFDTAKQ